jgi:hypothetical protein
VRGVVLRCRRGRSECGDFVVWWCGECVVWCGAGGGGASVVSSWCGAVPEGRSKCGECVVWCGAGGGGAIAVSVGMFRRAGHRHVSRYKGG